MERTQHISGTNCTSRISRMNCTPIENKSFSTKEKSSVIQNVFCTIMMIFLAFCMIKKCPDSLKFKNWPINGGKWQGGLEVYIYDRHESLDEPLIQNQHRNDMIIELKKFKIPLSLKCIAKCKFFHEYLIFKTCSQESGASEYWWSIEKNVEQIYIQRCSSEQDVINKFLGDKRPGKSNYIESIHKNIRSPFSEMFEEIIIQGGIKYNVYHYNCQKFSNDMSNLILKWDTSGGIIRSIGYNLYTTGNNIDRQLSFPELSCI